MYKVTGSDGNVIANLENPLYISISESGSYFPCNANKARGIAINGVPYHLIGRDLMSGKEQDVLLEEINGGEVILKNTRGVNDLTDQMIAVQELMVEQALDNDLSGLEGLEDLDI